MKKLQAGFTLIELMVVVAIIGVLIAAGILAYSNAQLGARESKRRGDMDAISKSMEQYFASNSAYPLAAVASTAILPYFPSGNLPTDPKNSGTYVYTLTGGTGTSFCACAHLEKAGLGNASNSGSGGGGACTYAAGGDYFCVSQRQ